MFGDTSRASSTVPASHRLANHAVDAEVFFVELPVIDKFAHGFPLLVPAAEFRDIARIFNHGEYIEIGRSDCKYGEENVENRVC